jgi:hypothetical protein
VGLCLSKIYATHFGGSFKIQSAGHNKGTVVKYRMLRDLNVLEIDT